MSCSKARRNSSSRKDTILNMAHGQCVVPWSVILKTRWRRNCSAATSRPGDHVEVMATDGKLSFHVAEPQHIVARCARGELASSGSPGGRALPITPADGRPRRLSLAVRLSHGYRFGSSKGWHARATPERCADRRRDRACASRNCAAVYAD